MNKKELNYLLYTLGIFKNKQLDSNLNINDDTHFTDSFEKTSFDGEDIEYKNSLQAAGEEIPSHNADGKIVENVSLIFSNIDTVCLTILLMYLLRCFLEILRGYSLAVMTKKLDIPITLHYYDHMVELPMEFHEVRKTGELMSRF